MHYYIDGYNLMFRILRVGDDLALQRTKIIEDLNQKALTLHLNVTIVFDAHYQIGDSSRSHFNQIEIVYSAKAQTADDYIVHEIKAKPKPLQNTVVTSDKKLAWLVRRHGAKTETVEEFLGWLNKRYENKKRIKKEPSIKKLPKLIPSKPPPISTHSHKPEECFAYYLESFQKQLEIIHTEQTIEINPFKKKKIKKKVEKMESDYARWERIFTEREKENGV